ncbi:pre-rRNA-processing protein ESF2 isoform X2 [Hevea brasiliensis]|nr:pre-rRNA-processing protein ESF2 isoform X2 [Hevea brasiliensis]XP_057992334.1 pre-rRNA-processing protein ESF2 isoform X2 [Hevea brasiliensis]
MANEEYKVNGSSSQNEGCPKSSAERATSRKNKKKKQSQESVKTEHEQEIHEHSPPAGGNLQAGDMRVESGKNKIKMKLLEEASLSKEGSKKCNGERKKKVKETKRQLLQKTAEDEEEDVNTVGFSQEVNPAAEGGKIETAKGKEEEEVIGINPIEEEDPKSNVEMVNRIKKKKKKKNKEQLLKEAAKADKRGVCYLSRIPPHMDHVKLRHILSQYGEIQRIYLAPEDPTARVNRKRAGGFRGQEFSEGWVEFTSKSIAKRVANMLNGEQIGGRKRSQFYYDLWNIKYLSKFKWDDLTEEIAHKSAIREQKLALEISAAKRERDFYLNKVDQSHALSSIEERLKKKQKVQQESGGQLSVGEQAPMVIRQFPQTKPVADKVEESKSQLSKDILAEVFGGL